MFELPCDAPASEATLDEAEAALDVRLPADYRWFLRGHGGGDFVFTVIYSADPNSDLALVYGQRFVPDGLLGLSDDGTGNIHVFLVVDGACEDRVLMWDHETRSVEPTLFEGFLDFVWRVGIETGLRRR